MEKVEDSPEKEKNFESVIDEISRNGPLNLTLHKFKTTLLFMTVNTGILLSILIVTGGSIRLAMAALVIGLTGPFLMLFLSKSLAKMSHHIQEIDPENFRSKNEEQLYRVVKGLAAKAGLKTIPELGIYNSHDMNAFATGWSKNHSMVAFSSALLEKMDERAISSVAAHEIAHIANGDMLSMTLIQSAVNTIVTLLDIGISLALSEDDKRAKGEIMVTVLRWIIVTVCMFLGNLFVLWFSRFREFAADRLAAKLIAPDAMIGALNFLKNDESLQIPSDTAQAQTAYASFKISSKSAFMDIFSTHPSLKRRIEKLRTLKQ